MTATIATQVVLFILLLNYVLIQQYKCYRMML